MMRNLILCFLSAFLLILSHPPFDFWVFAWIGLIPLMMACHGEKPRRKRGYLRRAFGIGYLCGIFFFTGTLYWFVHVTLPGAVLVVLYLATYFGLFGLAVRVSSKKSPVSRLFFLPCVWVVLEFIRSKLITGFDWVSMGHSQYKVLPLIQMADVTGVFGVSFLVVMVNVFIMDIIIKRGQRPFFLLKKGRCPLFICPLFLLLTLGYGFFRLSTVDPSARPSLRVAIIQANIEQKLKWQPHEWQGIMTKYKELTVKAAAHKPDVIIWPETSFPGYVWEATAEFKNLRKFVAQRNIPLLFGAITMEGEEGEEEYYNSAILLSGDGEIVRKHNKLHLVPFGEYIPFRKYFPFLFEMIPIEDFTAGREKTLFPIDSKHLSVLICFEDTVAKVARGLVRQGAQLLVNITNDAWFLDTNAPLLHLQSSVFRTIENRRSLIRVANTGVSCFIDTFGRIYNPVENDRKKRTYVQGYSIDDVVLSDKETFYTKFGDIFAICCFGCILWGMGGRFFYYDK